MTYPPQPPPYGSNQPGPTQAFGPPQPHYQPPVVSGPPYQHPPIQPYGAPPPGFQQPQPEPSKKRSPWVTIGVGLAVLVFLCLVGGVIQSFRDGAGGGTRTTSTADDAVGAGQAEKPASKPKPKAKALPGLGDAVRDGKFEFVVSGIDCSKTTLGNDFLNTKAQGKFCVVSMSVKNIGDEPQTFTGGEQKAYDISGAEFTNDGGAEFYANDNNQTFLNDINPGNKVNGKVVFDVPKTTTLTTLELHDSVFSGGVKLALH
jgi:Domain of unknown function (DUF4352)